MLSCRYQYAPKFQYYGSYPVICDPGPVHLKSISVYEEDREYIKNTCNIEEIEYEIT